MWLTVYSSVEWVIRVVMLLVILRRRFTPAASLAWLSFVFLVPPLGVLVYLLVGDHRLGRRRLRLYQRLIVARRPGEAVQARQMRAVTSPRTAEAQLPVIAQAERISGMPILGGNHVELLGGQTQFIDRLVADIDAAEHHAHLLFYIISNDQTGRRVGDALVRATRRGVRCRVLADDAGSHRFFTRSGLARKLREAGVATASALPVRLLRTRLQRVDLRNHRKLAVIDGKVGYTGSHNIVNPDYGHPRAGHWVDLSGRYTGPVVAQLQATFVEDWLFETGEELTGPDIVPALGPAGSMTAQCVPTGPGEDEESQTVRRVLLAAINSARRKLIITSPYLVPDEPTMVALTMAADRGVEVNIVMPRRSDHPVVHACAKAYFEQLLEAGVHIHLFDGGLLHAKTISVDDTFALLGSSNFDIRSFYLAFEVMVLMYGPEITRELRFAQTRYLSESRALSLEEWRRRPLWRRYVHSAAALLSPLL